MTRHLRLLPLLSLFLLSCEQEGQLQPIAAQVEVSPRRLDFPDTLVGSTSTAEVSLRNVSRSRLHLTLTTEGPFGVEAEALELEVGATRQLSVAFQPVEAGVIQGKLHVTTQGGALQVELAGVASPVSACETAVPCRQAHFDANTRQCVEELAPDGASCQEACLEGGKCLRGECVGRQRDCDDGNACTEDACSAGTGCTSTPRSCAPAEDSCQVAYCDSATGCGLETVADGTACSLSSDAATRVCRSGKCSLMTKPGTQLVVGFGHTCMLHEDRTVSCWGYNGYGQLGDGTFTDRWLPTEVPGLTDVVQLAAGMYFTCAMRTDGLVSCWGQNAYGQLGRGIGSESLAEPTPAQVYSPTATAITAGDTEACALIPNTYDDGSPQGRNITQAMCWGTAWDEAHARQSIVALTDREVVTHVAVGRQVGCFVSDGYLSCWGVPGVERRLGAEGWDPYYDVPIPFTTAEGRLSYVVEVAAGIGICTRMDTGRVLCWGWSSVPDAPADVPALAGAVELQAQSHSGCARFADGTGRCWGGAYGTRLHEPHGWQGLGPVKQIASSDLHTCALLPGGGYTCWGNNQWGSLGTGDTVSKRAP